MLATASRAPSVHNTQPWRFAVGTHAIDLYADPERKLGQDRDGREMLISCGAALFGLRLAVRGLGYLPAVTLFSERSKPWLLARVALGPEAPVTEAERRMLTALPHRHTHRGAFDPGPIPGGLLAQLQHDALAEGATLALVETAGKYGKLADLAAEAAQNAGAQRRGACRDPALEPPARQPSQGRRAGGRVRADGPGRAGAARPA